MLSQMAKVSLVLKKCSALQNRCNMANFSIIILFLRRKVGVFGHMCRMENNREIKDVMMGMIREQGDEEIQGENGWMT